MGHEFTSLILALLQTGGHPPKVDAGLIEQIKALRGAFRFETFISLSCHNCPDVVQALNLMAVLNPGVESVMIDGALHQEEVNARQIMAGPAVFLNGEPFGQGRMSIEEIVAKLDTGAAAHEAEKLKAKDVFDVLVGGGGNSGVEAAIDLAVIVAHVTLLEFDSKLRADAVLQDKLNSLSNVTVIKSAQTTEVTGDGHKVTGIVYTDRVTNESHRIELEGIFVQIGLLPNTDWLKGTINLTRYDEIEIDARCQTSVPGIYAAGGARTGTYKQIIIAMGEGSKASLSAFDHLIRTPVSS